ncbi:MAG: hypothetical protein GYA16_12345 [Spirochaetes bacterium]|nr:hypothetical protein [Spirochaetota bacterium]
MKKITRTNDIKTNTPIRVYKKGYGYTLLTLIENNDLFLICKSPEDFFTYIPENETVECYIWPYPDGSYDFTTTVLGKISSPFPIILLKHTDSVVYNPTRQCLRAKVKIPFTFFTFSINTTKSFSSEDIQWHQGTILELTDREALLNTEITPEHFVKGHLHLGTKDIDITGKVTGINSTHYDISFVGLDDTDRIAILDYIFTVYRE